MTEHAITDTFTRTNAGPSAAWTVAPSGGFRITQPPPYEQTLGVTASSAEGRQQGVVVNGQRLNIPAGLSDGDLVTWTFRGGVLAEGPTVTPAKT